MSREKAIEKLRFIRNWYLPSQDIHKELSNAIQELEEEGKDGLLINRSKTTAPKCAWCGGKLDYTAIRNEAGESFCTEACRKAHGQRGVNTDYWPHGQPVQEYRPKCDWCLKPLGLTTIKDDDGNAFCSWACQMAHEDRQNIINLMAWRDKVSKAMGVLND